LIEPVLVLVLARVVLVGVLLLGLVVVVAGELLVVEAGEVVVVLVVVVSLVTPSAVVTVPEDGEEVDVPGDVLPVSNESVP